MRNTATDDDDTDSEVTDDTELSPSSDEDTGNIRCKRKIIEQIAEPNCVTVRAVKPKGTKQPLSKNAHRRKSERKNIVSSTRCSALRLHALAAEAKTKRTSSPAFTQASPTVDETVNVQTDHTNWDTWSDHSFQQPLPLYEDDMDRTLDDCIFGGNRKGYTYIPKKDDITTTCSPAWTEKYRPTKVEQIVGNVHKVASITQWLQDHKNKVAGTLMALVIIGPPGVGKTSAVRAIAFSAGYDVDEIVANQEVVDCRTLTQKRAGKIAKQNLVTGMIIPAMRKKKTGRPRLVFVDECDVAHTDNKGSKNMFHSLLPSRSENGKTKGILEVIKPLNTGGRVVRTSHNAKSRAIVGNGYDKNWPSPLVLCVNDWYAKKMKPLRDSRLCKTVFFDKPKTAEISSLLRRICVEEKILFKEAAISRVSGCSNGDVRKAVAVLEECSRMLGKNSADRCLTLEGVTSQCSMLTGEITLSKISAGRTEVESSKGLQSLTSAERTSCRSIIDRLAEKRGQGTLKHSCDQFLNTLDKEEKNLYFEDSQKLIAYIKRTLKGEDRGSLSKIQSAFDGFVTQAHDLKETERYIELHREIRNSIEREHYQRTQTLTEDTYGEADSSVSNNVLHDALAMMDEDYSIIRLCDSVEHADQKNYSNLEQMVKYLYQEALDTEVVDVRSKFLSDLPYDKSIKATAIKRALQSGPENASYALVHIFGKEYVDFPGNASLMEYKINCVLGEVNALDSLALSSQCSSDSDVLSTVAGRKDDEGLKKYCRIYDTVLPCMLSRRNKRKKITYNYKQAWANKGAMVSQYTSHIAGLKRGMVIKNTIMCRLSEVQETSSSLRTILKFMWADVKAMEALWSNFKTIAEHSIWNQSQTLRNDLCTFERTSKILSEDGSVRGRTSRRWNSLEEIFRYISENHISSFQGDRNGLKTAVHGVLSGLIDEQEIKFLPWIHGRIEEDIRGGFDGSIMTDLVTRFALLERKRLETKEKARSTQKKSVTVIMDEKAELICRISEARDKFGVCLSAMGWTSKTLAAVDYVGRKMVIKAQKEKVNEDVKQESEYKIKICSDKEDGRSSKTLENRLDTNESVTKNKGMCTLINADKGFGAKNKQVLSRLKLDVSRFR